MSLLPDGTVIPLDRLPTRRDFCQAVCLGGAALVTIAGCGGDPAAPTDGGKGDMAQAAGEDLTQSPQPDMSTDPADMAEEPGDMAQGPTDMTGGSPDMANANACPPNGVVKSGMKANAFAVNTATLVGQASAYICRDNGGLFCVSSICTHQGCSVGPVNNGAGGFLCPCHGSAFSFTGAVTNGPAGRALDHFALCVDSNGNVAIATLQTVATNKRYAF